ncbi:MAG: glutamine--fructose-6-phosphate transaminase (isomerizing) [Elusimicrobiota bacterium]
MCGIIGYLGNNKALPKLVSGLKRLEYRGYDSAGISVIQENKLFVAKEKGKISNLEKTIRGLPPKSFKSLIGIGHTRWATHGAPSSINAHPHLSQDNKIAIVHNGIIENYQTIKDSLKLKSIKFTSDTDSEVIVHLIAYYYKGDFTEAVRLACLQLEGAFGIAAIHVDHPDMLIGAKRGSPLIVGLDDGGIYLSSDILGFSGNVRKVVYLEENNIVEIKGNRHKIITLDKQTVAGRIASIGKLELDSGLGGFKHFMAKEINLQPESVMDSMRGRLLINEGTAKLNGLNLVMDELRKIHRIIFIGCGTSWHAAMVAEYMIEEIAGIPCEVEYASEFRYRNPVIEPNTLVFAISQSGETADTLAAIMEAKSRGATVLGICNVVGSSIARQTHGGIYLHAGPEIGVASTKAFSSQVTVLALLCLLLARMRRLSMAKGVEIARALEKIPEQIKSVLKQESKIKSVAAHYKNSKNFLYLGRGINYPVALEGALKLKEISYIHAEGYPAAEMKHGPIALIDDNMPTFIIAPSDGTHEKIVSNVQEIRARGGRVISIINRGDKTLARLSNHVIEIPKTLDMMTPLLTVIPLQLFAYHVAVMNGHDIDKPRNLAKSVTVE